MPPDPVVYIVDDDRAVRDSLRFLVESVDLSVRICETGRAFFDCYEPTVPGCLVVDVRMPEMSGVEVLEVMAERGVEIPVIVITGYGDVPTAVRAMQRGAVDFIEKPFNDQLLLERIQQCIDADSRKRRGADRRTEIRARMATLTPREREVMGLVVEGRSNKAMARTLGVSPKTVEVHRARVMQKMQADSLAELVRMAMNRQSDEAGR